MSNLRPVPTLLGVATLRRVSSLRAMSTAGLCWGGVGRGLARTGFVLLLLRRSTSPSHCGYGEKNQQ